MTNRSRVASLTDASPDSDSPARLSVLPSARRSPPAPRPGRQPLGRTVSQGGPPEG